MKTKKRTKKKPRKKPAAPRAIHRKLPQKKARRITRPANPLPVFIIIAIILGTAIVLFQPAQRSGLPNPAAVHCNDQGGYTILVATPQGQAGYCILPDTRVCEQWELFRTGQCTPPSEESAALSVAELLTNPVYDPETWTAEYKACAVNISKL